MKRYPRLDHQRIFQCNSSISFKMKLIGKRSAGKPHAAFDLAGAGNMVCNVKMRAPVLDPTFGGAGR